MQKSQLYQYLENEEGFTINDPQNSPEGITGREIYDLFVLLLKLGTAKDFGYDSIFLVTPQFSMIYFPGEPQEQFIPSLRIELHNPKIFGFRTFYRFSLKNGLFVEWDGNGLPPERIHEYIREIRKFKGIIMGNCEREDRSFWDIHGIYSGNISNLFPEIIKPELYLWIAQRCLPPDIMPQRQ